MRSPDELRELVDAELTRLPLADELGELEEALRYSLLGGGKRIRPVLCLATGEALGASPPGCCPLPARSSSSTPSASSTTTCLRWTTTTCAAASRAPTCASARGRHPRRRRTPDRGLPPRARLREPGAGSGARRRDPRDDRGPVRGRDDRRRPRRRRARPPARAEDRQAAARVGHVRGRGRGPPVRRAGAVGGLRRGARPALPDRRRHPRRHGHGLRARQDAREGRGRRQGHVRLAARARARAGAGRRGAGAGERAPGRAAGGHGRPGRARRHDSRPPHREP